MVYRLSDTLDGDHPRETGNIPRNVPQHSTARKSPLLLTGVPVRPDRLTVFAVCFQRGLATEALLPDERKWESPKDGQDVWREDAPLSRIRLQTCVLRIGFADGFNLVWQWAVKVYTTSTGEERG